MKIDEAIKILVKEARHYQYLPDREKESATKLGIEALKRIGAYRHFPDRGPGELLPGETKD